MRIPNRFREISRAEIKSVTGISAENSFEIVLEFRKLN